MRPDTILHTIETSGIGRARAGSAARRARGQWGPHAYRGVGALVGLASPPRSESSLSDGGGGSDPRALADAGFLRLPRRPAGGLPQRRDLSRARGLQGRPFVPRLDKAARRAIVGGGRRGRLRGREDRLTPSRVSAF